MCFLESFHAHSGSVVHVFLYASQMNICHLSGVKGWPTFSALRAGEHGAGRCAVCSSCYQFVCCWSSITDCEGTEHDETQELLPARGLCSLAFSCTFPERMRTPQWSSQTNKQTNKQKPASFSLPLQLRISHYQVMNRTAEVLCQIRSWVEGEGD